MISTKSYCGFDEKQSVITFSGSLVWCDRRFAKQMRDVVLKILQLKPPNLKMVLSDVIGIDVQCEYQLRNIIQSFVQRPGCQLTIELPLHRGHVNRVVSYSKSEHGNICLKFI